MTRNPKVSRRVKAGRIAALLSGLTALAAASGVHAASFDCAKAALPDEKAVCANLALNDQDVRMGLLYQLTPGLVAMGQRGDLQDGQVQFLKDRKACGANVPCIATLYRKRIAVMMAIMTTVAQNGPF
jgi:uncharacterized protein